MAVYPSTAKDLPVVDLADLVVAVLPSEGFENLGWSYMGEDAIIAWQTEGVARRESTVGFRQDGTETKEDTTVREGFVRARVAGIPSTILLQNREELVWTVTLETALPEKFGPKSITIRPGMPDSDHQCFGTLTDGCTFTPAQALASTKLKSHIVCRSSHFTENNNMQAFAVSAPEKKTSLLVYYASGGSGGDSSWLEIRPLDDESTVCKSAESE